jgi:hypothetical protein
MMAKAILVKQVPTDGNESRIEHSYLIYDGTRGVDASAISGNSLNGLVIQCIIRKEFNPSDLELATIDTPQDFGIQKILSCRARRCGALSA